MLIRHCSYTASLAYSASYDGTSLSQSFSGIEVSGISYNLITNPYLDDVGSIQDFLDGLGIGTVTWAFIGGYATLTSYNNPNLITKIFIISDKDGSPVPWEKLVTQSDCQYLQDPNVVRGCTDPDAKNYNSLATEDNGTCEYNPTAEIDIIRCKMVDNAHKVIVKIRKGDVKDYDSEMDCLWWQSKGVDIYNGHVFVGEIVIPDVDPTDAVPAAVTINLTAFIDYTGFIVMTISVNGVDQWIDTGSYIGTLGDYADLLTYIAAIVTYINANPTSPAYTASQNGYLLTIEAVTAGAGSNGYPVLFDGDQLTVNGVDIPTPGYTPTFGCYDPNRNEIWFGSFATNVCLIFNAGVQTGVVDATTQTGEVVYNPDLQVKYCGLPQTSPASGIIKIDNANSIAGYLATTTGGTYYGVYNPIYSQFAFTNGLTGVSSSVDIFDSNSEALLTNTALNAADNILEITYNPQAGARQGFYYAALGGTNKIAVIDPSTGVASTFTTGTFSPACVQFIEDVNGGGVGVYELWVGGVSSNIIRRYTENGVLIGDITLPAYVNCLNIKFNSVNGYVFCASYSTAIDVFVIDKDTLTIVCPTFEVGVGCYGIVVDTSTGDTYVAIPFADKVTIINLSDGIINNSYDLAGGEDASTFTRPEVDQTASNNCTDDDDIETMLQTLHDGTTGCCD